MTCFRPEEWQHVASLRLQALLKSATLRRLVGDFERALRADRRAETGQDRPSNVAELADALLIAHDVDLFAQAEVRKAVVRALGGEGIRKANPGRWVAGQRAAHRFVSEAGFPPELAGSAADGRPTAFMQVMPPAEYKPLAPYQAEVRDMLYARLNQAAPENRAMVSLPTGAGKTRVAVETLHRWAHDTLERGEAGSLFIVWLAHTEELCEQAVACFEDVWRSHPHGSLQLGLGRFWGAYRRTIDLADAFEGMHNEHPVLVFVSTPQSFVAETFETGPEVGVVVIDEAHRAAAPTYKHIIDRHRNAALVGLTATPYRREFDRRNPQAGTRELRDLFRHLVLPRALGDDAQVRLERLQEMRVLSRPLVRTVETGVTLNVGREPALDDFNLVFNFDQELQSAADQTRRRRVVLDAVFASLDQDPAARILYFGPSVMDAELVAFMLRLKGRRAAAVSGHTKVGTRRTLIADFKAGRIDVLCNCEVLTTGFDAPTVTHVMMARPTISQVLYEQMVGRGLRGPAFGGTGHCVIVDFKDRYRSHQPILGYERFRDVWQPGTRLPQAPANAQFGLLLQLGPGAAHRYVRNARGISTCRSRPSARALRIPLAVRLEGMGSGRLLLRTLHAGTESWREEIVLDAANRMQRVDVEVPAGGQLVFQASTQSHAHIEVRRHK